MEVLNQPVSSVLQSVGRRSPRLGGGAASILSGLVGASLVRMALDMSEPETDARVAAAIRALDELTAELEQSVRDDIAVFREYVSALKLPHDERRQEAEREAALAEAGVKAAATPLESAYLLVKAMELAADIASHIKNDVLSDLYAGSAVLNGAFFGVLATADINLKPGRVAAARAPLEEQREDVLHRRSIAADSLAKSAREAGFTLR